MTTTDGLGSSALDNYTGYCGLPPLVGLLSMEEAATEGLSVTEAVDRLKRLHWALKRLHGIFILRLTSMPVYELKMAFSLHAHYCSEHVAHLGKRIREMRQPPYGLDISPEPALDIFFDEVLSAPSTAALVMGLYEFAIPAVNAALDAFLRDTSRLFDHPTYRAIRFAQVEFAEVREYAEAAVQALVTEQDRADLLEWSESLRCILAHAGGLDGMAVRDSRAPQRTFSVTPFEFDPIPQRDERFTDPYNMGVNAEAMLFDPAIPRSRRRSCCSSSVCARSMCRR